MRLFKKRIRDKSDNCPYCNQSRDSLFYMHVAHAHQNETAIEACGTPELRVRQKRDDEPTVEQMSDSGIMEDENIIGPAIGSEPRKVN